MHDAGAVVKCNRCGWAAEHGRSGLTALLRKVISPSAVAVRPHLGPLPAGDGHTDTTPGRLYSILAG